MILKFIINILNYLIYKLIYMEDYKDNLIFAETFITNNEFTISEVVNTNSDKLNFFLVIILKIIQ